MSRDKFGDGIGRSRAIHHFKRTGVILPGHADTIAAYRAAGDA